jgi:hypothetical protein
MIKDVLRLMWSMEGQLSSDILQDIHLQMQTFLQDKVRDMIRHAIKKKKARAKSYVGLGGASRGGLWPFTASTVSCPPACSPPSPRASRRLAAFWWACETRARTGAPARNPWMIPT